jgi:hypothetical protein
LVGIQVQAMLIITASVGAPGGDGWETSDSDGDDLDEAFEASEFLLVAGVQRKADRTGCRGNEEIHGASSSCLTPGGNGCRIDPAVGTSRLTVKGKGVERGLGALQPILSTRSLVGVIGGMRSSREFGHGDRTDGEFARELGGIEFP